MKTPRNTIVVYAGVGHSINVNVAPRSTANIIVISSSFVTLIGLAWAPALRHGPLTTIHLIHATMMEAICHLSVQLLDAGTQVGVVVMIASENFAGSTILDRCT